MHRARAPAADMFGNTGATFCSVIITLVGLLNSVIWLLSGLAFAIFMWGMVRFIWKTSDSQGHKEGKQLITWGLVALFVIFSISGILNFMSVSLFGSASSTASQGSSCGKSFTEPQTSVGGVVPPVIAPSGTNGFEPQSSSQ